MLFVINYRLFSQKSVSYDFNGIQPNESTGIILFKLRIIIISRFGVCPTTYKSGIDTDEIANYFYWIFKQQRLTINYDFHYLGFIFELK